MRGFGKGGVFYASAKFLLLPCIFFCNFNLNRVLSNSACEELVFHFLYPSSMYLSDTWFACLVSTYNWLSFTLKVSYDDTCLLY